MARPDWWDWPLELTPHVVRRMEERGLAEVGLRDLLETARSVRKDAHVEGRFLIVAEHAGRSWVVIVEPDEQDRVLVAITVFPLE